MASTGQDGPTDSEKSAEEWLRQVGAKRIKYVGQDGEGPPDFVVEYSGCRVAVEVCLLHDVDGWNKREYRKYKYSFEKQLMALIKEQAARGKNAPRWHASCEYDGVECISSICDRKWQDEARRALQTPGVGGEFQLLPKETRRGRGIVLTLMPASNEGSFSGVSMDEGSIVGVTLSERIVAGVREKAKKVRGGTRAREYDRWWLVLDDEILVAPIEILTREERADIQTRVRDCPDRSIWSKIVLMNRFQSVTPPQTAPKSYWAVWEESRHPPLPR